MNSKTTLDVNCPPNDTRRPNSLAINTFPIPKSAPCSPTSNDTRGSIEYNESCSKVEYKRSSSFSASISNHKSIKSMLKKKNGERFHDLASDDGTGAHSCSLPNSPVDTGPRVMNSNENIHLYGTEAEQLKLLEELYCVENKNITSEPVDINSKDQSKRYSTRNSSSQRYELKKQRSYTNKVNDLCQYIIHKTSSGSKLNGSHNKMNTAGQTYDIIRSQSSSTAITKQLESDKDKSVKVDKKVKGRSISLKMEDMTRTFQSISSPKTWRKSKLGETLFGSSKGSIYDGECTTFTDGNIPQHDGLGKQSTSSLKRSPLPSSSQGGLIKMFQQRRSYTQDCIVRPELCYNSDIKVQSSGSDELTYVNNNAESSITNKEGDTSTLTKRGENSDDHFNVSNYSIAKHKSEETLVNLDTNRNNSNEDEEYSNSTYEVKDLSDILGTLINETIPDEVFNENQTLGNPLVPNPSSLPSNSQHTHNTSAEDSTGAGIENKAMK